MAHATIQFFWIPAPPPPEPWGRSKRSNIIKSQSQSQFQRFLNQTLCVFLRMKDIKPDGICIRSPGWDLGYHGGWGQFFPKIQPDLGFSRAWDFEMARNRMCST